MHINKYSSDKNTFHNALLLFNCSAFCNLVKVHACFFLRLPGRWDLIDPKVIFNWQKLLNYITMTFFMKPWFHKDVSLNRRTHEVLFILVNNTMNAWFEVHNSYNSQTSTFVCLDQCERYGTLHNLQIHYAGTVQFTVKHCEVETVCLWSSSQRSLDGSF